MGQKMDADGVYRACHAVWGIVDTGPFHSLYRKECAELKRLMEQQNWSPLQIVTAWAMYVTDENPLYHQQPVVHVDSFVSKAGNRIVREVEDQSAVTKFPFLSFLATASGFLLSAAEELKHFKEHKCFTKHFRRVESIVRTVMKEIKT